MLATTVSIKPGKLDFSCYDPTLAHRLNQACVQAGQQAVLKLRDASFNEGSAGVVNAVERLWTKIGAGIVSIPTLFSAAEDPALAGDSAPITGRDLIALLATLGIDTAYLC